MPADSFPNDTLDAALARHGVELPAEQAAKLDRYARLLWDWNEKLNLTRHTNYEKFVARDVIDTRAFSQCIAAEEDVLDVGSGGGVPGVVLAILRPELSVSLSESVAKKAKVLGSIVDELQLDVPVHHGKAQDLLADGLHDTLIVRAVAPLSKLLTWFQPHWSHFRRLLVLKGPAWVEERAAARHAGLMNDLQLRKLLSYPLSGTDSESVLLEIRGKEKGKAKEKERA